MKFLKLLYPGIKIKRWLFLALLGLFLIGAGLSVINNNEIMGWLEKLVKYYSIQLTGQSHHLYGGILTIILGLIFIIVGFRQMFINIIMVVVPENEDKLVNIIYNKHHLRRGPKIVVLGGGTGLSVLLRGLKQYTSNITAIVTVSDDGGNSGQLRNELGILAPGDIRNCLVALADKETLMEELLQFRFSDGNSLTGHNMGNLFIAAMTEITGHFDQAIKEMSKVLAIRGQVIPATLENVTLLAELEDGSIIEGESNIPLSNRKIKRVFLNPQECHPVQESLDAIRDADAIVLGPGSLYTSILPNLLVQGIPEAINNSKALKIYASNIMTQPGETVNYTASMHIKPVVDTLGKSSIDYAIVNVEDIPKKLQKKYHKEGAIPVIPDVKEIEKMGIKVAKSKLVYETDVVRHDSEKLSKAIITLIVKNKSKAERIGLVDFFQLGEKLRELLNNNHNHSA